MLYWWLHYCTIALHVVVHSLHAILLKRQVECISLSDLVWIKWFYYVKRLLVRIFSVGCWLSNARTIAFAATSSCGKLWGNCGPKWTHHSWLAMWASYGKSCGPSIFLIGLIRKSLYNYNDVRGIFLDD